MHSCSAPNLGEALMVHPIRHDRSRGHYAFAQRRRQTLKDQRCLNLTRAATQPPEASLQHG